MAADIGWITLADASTYFVTRLNSAAWTGGAVTDATRTSALTMAYNRIRYHDKLTIPATPTAAEDAILEDAQCELAIYMLQHLPDEDRRKGLQAQAVKAAGVVKEQYKKDDLMGLPLPPIVWNMLAGFWKYDAPFYAKDIDRDEDEAVNSDVTEV